MSAVHPVRSIAPLLLAVSDDEIDDASEASSEDDEETTTGDAGGDVVDTSVQFIVMLNRKEHDVTFGVIHLRITKVSTPAPMPHCSLEATPHPSVLVKEQAG